MKSPAPIKRLGTGPDACCIFCLGLGPFANEREKTWGLAQADAAGCGSWSWQWAGAAWARPAGGEEGDGCGTQAPLLGPAPAALAVSGS